MRTSEIVNRLYALEAPDGSVATNPENGLRDRRPWLFFSIECAEDAAEKLFEVSGTIYVIQSAAVERKAAR